MSERSEYFREAVSASRRGVEAGERWKCPADLRGQITAWASALCSEGERVGTLATQVGLSRGGLERWLPQSKKRVVRSGFRPVEVVQSTAGNQLTLTSPGGYRVDGLSIESLADLLSRL